MVHVHMLNSETCSFLLMFCVYSPASPRNTLLPGEVSYCFWKEKNYKRQVSIYFSWFTMYSMSHSWRLPSLCHYSHLWTALGKYGQTSLLEAIIVSFLKQSQIHIKNKTIQSPFLLSKTADVFLKKHQLKWCNSNPH